jgi:hypothetical protein
MANFVPVCNLQFRQVFRVVEVPKFDIELRSQSSWKNAYACGARRLLPGEKLQGLY